MENLNDKKLEKMIYNIRGKRVMLEDDVANFFECSAKDVRKAVKKNPKNFPTDFCFKLTKAESEKIGITSKNTPYAFTSNAICMLSWLLNTEVAINMSIYIVETVVKNGGGLFRKK